MPLMDHRHIERVVGPGLGRDEQGRERCAPAEPETRAQLESPSLRDRTAAEGGELFRRAKFLCDDDRLLIELAFKNQLSVRQIARALKKSPGLISRRLMSLCRHLRDPNVLVLIDPAFPFPLGPEHRQLAIEHFVQRRSCRQLADVHQMPIHEVRRVLSYVKGWCKGVVSSGRAR